jgi:zinc transporter ZupT
MILTLVVLIGCVWLGGLSVNLLKGEKLNIQVPLIFAGSYLFAVTIIHIIPELYTLTDQPQQIGIFVLGGFFLQRMLEYFSRGIEHGHTHSHGIDSGSVKFSILIALIIHSVLEGALLTHESPFHDQHKSYSLLLGIVLHKMPAAFALMIVLWHSRSKWWLLLIFSLASPAGMLLSNYISLGHSGMITLFAVVGGSFLHISTTIFVESSPEHSLSWKKTLVSLLGAGLAILAEYMM